MREQTMRWLRPIFFLFYRLVVVDVNRQSGSNNFLRDTIVLTSYFAMRFTPFHHKSFVSRDEIRASLVTTLFMSPRPEDVCRYWRTSSPAWHLHSYVPRPRPAHILAPQT